MVLVDPGDAKPVISYVTKNNLLLDAILVTHHHWDHTDGIPELIRFAKDIPVFASINSPHSFVTHRLNNGDTLSVFDNTLSFTALAIPGHTLDHMAYFSNQMVFCGDTLFACGCGKVFEGTYTQMAESLSILKQLPDDTLVYCGHEYTLANIQFALTVDSQNTALQKRLEEALQCQRLHQPTLPVSMALEKQTNPFLRCEGAAAFEQLRRQKDNYTP